MEKTLCFMTVRHVYNYFDSVLILIRKKNAFYKLTKTPLNPFKFIYFVYHLSLDQFYSYRLGIFFNIINISKMWLFSFNVSLY